MQVGTHKACRSNRKVDVKLLILLEATANSCFRRRHGLPWHRCGWPPAGRVIHSHGADGKVKGLRKGDQSGFGERGQGHPSRPQWTECASPALTPCLTVPWTKGI